MEVHNDGACDGCGARFARDKAGAALKGETLAAMLIGLGHPRSATDATIIGR